MRIFIAVILTASFFPEAVAEPILPVGKPAGIKQAMSTSERKEMYVIGAVLLVSTGAAIALIGRKVASTATKP